LVILPATVLRLGVNPASPGNPEPPENPGKKEKLFVTIVINPAILQETVLRRKSRERRRKEGRQRREEGETNRTDLIQEGATSMDGVEGSSVTSVTAMDISPKNAKRKKISVTDVKVVVI
jgi:hypothetical protein